MWSLTKYVFCCATYECSERGSKLSSQEGKGDAAEKTKQRRNSHEKSNLPMKPYVTSIHQQDLAHQGLVNAGSFAKADCDAVKAKHGEVKHGEADSSKAEAVLGKEMESSDCERKNMRTENPFLSGTCVFSFPTEPL